jgi:hypothetical protein
MVGSVCCAGINAKLSVKKVDKKSISKGGAEFLSQPKVEKNSRFLVDGGPKKKVANFQKLKLNLKKLKIPIQYIKKNLPACGRRILLRINL